MHHKLVDLITQDAIRLFQLDEEKLFDMKVRYGCRYLENLYSGERHVEKTLKAHPKFWEWWTDLWAQRDRTLIQACQIKRWGIDYTYPENSAQGTSYPATRTRQITVSELAEFYEDWHYWSRIKFYPNPDMVSLCMADAPQLESYKIEC